MTVWLEGNSGFYLASGAQIIEEDREIASDWARQHIHTYPDRAWLVGRFVEADRPNLNRQLFSLAGLQMNGPSIEHAPMNLNHHQRRVVGSFTAAEMIYPTDDDELNPFIDTLGVVWKAYFPDEYALIQRAHSEGALSFCVDPETEIMTDEGWSRYEDLRVGQEILTLNTATGLSEWTPCQAVNVFDHDGPMHRMEGMMHSSLTTPNHRWWVERKKSRGGRVKEWRTSETLTTLCWIPRAVPHADFPTEPKYTDAMVELVAWFYTEGHADHNTVVLSQSATVNPLNCTRIENALRKTFGAPAKVRNGGTWYPSSKDQIHKSGRTCIGNEYHLSAAAGSQLLALAPNKVPSASFLRSLTASQMDMFIKISLDADGTRAKIDGQTSFSQKDVNRTRAFEMACALAGLPTNTIRVPVSSYPGKEMYEDNWRACVIRRSDQFNPLSLDQRRRLGVLKNPDEGLVVDQVHYQGKVWCPTTPNGTFLARRRGTVYWTGNSMESVPERVQCVGDGGCGEEFAYAGRTSPTYCNELNKGLSDKFLINPLFTAGAVLIPPIKPGWSKADVHSLVAAHSEMSDRIYAGIQEEFPHLDAPQWESMMSALLAEANA